MVWRFLKHYGINKATDVLNDFASAVVAFDPQTASRAQVTMMEAELNKLGHRLAEADAELQREHRETLALKTSYEQYLQAAHVLEAKASSSEDPAKTAEIETSLAMTLDQLEALKPEIEREEREDREVEAWRRELHRSYEDLAGKIQSAQAQLKSARRQMDMANLRKERALEQDRQAKRAAGLTSAISSLSVALDTMNQETSKVRAETEALKLKAGLLQTNRLDGDPHVAAALARVRGDASSDRASLSDRLTALGGRGDDKRRLITAA